LLLQEKNPRFRESGDSDEDEDEDQKRRPWSIFVTPIEAQVIGGMVVLQFYLSFSEPNML
jgi:hypothetical protein